MKISSSFGMAFGTVALGLTGLIVACGGADNLDVLGATPGNTGTSGESSGTSGTASGGTSGATSGGTSGVSTSSGVTSSSGTTSGQTSSGCVKCGIALPAGCKFTSECGCDYTCPDAGGSLNCQWTQDGKGNCPDGSFCDAPDCVTGVCVKKSDSNSTDLSPQCGCNGVTFWNAGLAKKNGMAIHAPGACTALTAKGCSAASGSPCTVNGSCNVQVSKKAECNTNNGACWVLPATCPAIAVGNRARPCGPTALTCSDACSAIKKQAAWYDDATCPN